MKGLFVGRFQPFHLGHLKTIKWILERCNKVTVIIGSSTESLTKRNPFTLEERKEMINRSLDEEGFKKDQYQIIGIADVFDCERWTKGIMKKVEFDVVFTMNAWVKQCFDLFGILVEKHPMYRKFSATQIRRMMDENEEWKSLVPKGSYEIINRINAKRRLVEQA